MDTGVERDIRSIYLSIYLSIYSSLRWLLSGDVSHRRAHECGPAGQVKQASRRVQAGREVHELQLHCQQVTSARSPAGQARGGQDGHPRPVGGAPPPPG